MYQFDAHLPGPWDDPNIHRPYNRQSVAEKVYNKLQLQEQRNLPLSDTLPLVASDGPVPAPAQAVRLDTIHCAADLTAVLAGCDILVTGDPALQTLARQYGTCPVADAGALAEALQFYEDAAAWYAIQQKLMEQSEPEGLI